MPNQINTTYEGELRPRLQPKGELRPILQLSGQVDSFLTYKDPRVDDILPKIPEEASADNKLADKEYVDEGYDNIRNDLIDHVEDEVAHITSQERTTWNAKQPALVSGTNIKTINGNSILGSGNLAVSGLPAITSADDGAFLRVVNGVASWVVLPVYEGGSY